MVLVIFGIARLAFFWYQKKASPFKPFIFFSLWFLLGIGLHLHFLPLDMTVADRWAYFASIGFLGSLMAILLYITDQKPKLSQHFFISLFFIICLLSLRSIERTFNWRTGLTLYKHDIKISHNAYDLENNLGVELFRNQEYKQAKVHFENSTKLAPDWWINWNNLGAIYEQEKNLDKAGQLYLKSIENGGYFHAYENYAQILVKQKKFSQAKTFIEKEALPRLPYNLNLRKLYLYAKQNAVE